MTKITLSDVSNILGNPTSAANTINANNDVIVAALDLLVSRDGETPNQMIADQDLNHNDLLNVGIVNADSLVLNGQVVTPDELATVPATVMLKAVYDPTGVNSDAFNSANHSYDPSQTGDVSRSVALRLRDEYSVKDFGAVANASTVANSAVTAMASALGYVRFTHGGYKLTTMTIDVPIYFEHGAYITVDLTNTITITNTVESFKQHIFRGAGNYSLGHDANSGEDARETHASWWGAFPNPALGADQAPAIAKGFASMGNARESIMHFDIGNYNIASTMAITRGGHVKGSGTRRTVFKLSADGFDVFTTSGVACKFTDIQFELHTSQITTRANSFITISQDDCELYNVHSGGDVALSILVSAGNNCRIQNVKASYGSAPAAGSALVRITGGALHQVKGIYVTSSSAFGPTHLVDLSAATAINSVTIEDIQTLNPAVPVRIRAAAANVTQVSIKNVIFTGFAGAVPAAVVHTLAESTFNTAGIVIEGINSNSRPSALIRVENTGTGTVENITINNSLISGSTGSGLEFVQSSSGAVRDIHVGASVEVAERTTPILYTGTVTADIHPQVLPNTDVDVTYFFSSMADDSAQSVNLRRSVFTGSAEVTGGTTRHGLFTIRAASTPAVSANRVTDANTTASAAVLTGTTGTDGNLNLGVQSGVLYVENRTGAVLNVSLQVRGA